MNNKDILLDGFLDKNVKIVEDNIIEKYKGIFNFIYDINRKAYKLFDDNKCVSKEYELAISLLYKNIHTSFQSSIILLKKGLANDSDIIFRSMYESLFKVKSIINNPDNFNLLILSSNHESKKFVRTIFEDDALKDFRTNTNKEEFEKMESKNVPILKFAQEAHMEQTYKREYALLCSNVHSDLRTLDKKISKNEKGLIINYDFDYNDIVNMLFSRINFFLEVMEILNQYFNKDNENKNLKPLYDTYNILLKKYFKES